MDALSLEGIPFDLDLTVSCGQAFRWKKHDGSWYAPVAGKVWRIRQERDLLLYEGPTEEELIRYFGLDVPLKDILKDIDRDPLIHAAIEKCYGDFAIFGRNHGNVLYLISVRPAQISRGLR